MPPPLSSPMFRLRRLDRCQGHTISDGHQIQGQYPPQCPNTCHCSNNTSDSQQDAQIVICCEHILYSIIAVLAIFIIDKELFVLPLVALLMAGMLVPLLVSPETVDRIFNLSAFRVEWMATPVKKHVRRCIVISGFRPMNKEMDTQTEAIMIPVYADQETGTITLKVEDNDTQTVTTPSLETGDVDPATPTIAPNEEGVKSQPATPPVETTKPVETTEQIEPATSTTPSDCAHNSGLSLLLRPCRNLQRPRRRQKSPKTAQFHRDSARPPSQYPSCQSKTSTAPPSLCPPANSARRELRIAGSYLCPLV